MKQNLDMLGCDDINLLSCMTLDVGNVHSVAHHKNQVSTAFRCVRNFKSTAKEAFKSTSRSVMLPSPREIIGPFLNTINTTTCSDQSCQRQNFKDAGLGECVLVFAKEKHRQGNYHGKGWNTCRLPVSKGSFGWRKSQLPVDFKCVKQGHATPGRT